MTDLAAGGKGAWNAADRKQKEREKDGWNATGEEQKKKKENFRNSIVKEQICGTMQKGMEQKKAALSQDETKESNTDEFCFAAGITRRRLNRERLPGFNDVCGGHRIWDGEWEKIMISKTMRSILHALSYGNIDVESSRRIADLKKLDAMRIFIRKLDTKICNGDYEVPVRMYFPSEETMEQEKEGKLSLPVLLFFHGGGWVTESVNTYNRVCARMAQSTGKIVVSVEYRLAPEHRFPTAFDDCYAAAKELYTNHAILNADPKQITVIGDSAGGNLAAAVCLKARDTGDFQVERQILIYPALNNCYTEASLGTGERNRLPADCGENGRLCDTVRELSRGSPESVFCAADGDGLQESSEDITSDRGTGSAARRGRGVCQKAGRSRKRSTAVPHCGGISRIFCAWNPVLACAGEFYVYQPVSGAVENRIGQVFGMTVERKKQQMTCLYQ